MSDRPAGQSEDGWAIESPRDAEVLLALDMRYPYGVASGDIADYLHRDGPMVAGALRRMHPLGFVQRADGGEWFVTQGTHRLIELLALDAREELFQSKRNPDA